MTRRAGCPGLVVNYDRASALRGARSTLKRERSSRSSARMAPARRRCCGRLPALRGRSRARSGSPGERIDGLTAPQIVARGIVMVPEGRHIYPLHVVNDNLLMGAYLRRDRRAVRDDLDDVFARFPRLKERRDSRRARCRAASRKCWLVSRALMARPKLLLLDEPSLGLAPLMTAEIARMIVSINREDGVSVVLVEQNSRLALSISHRAYVLETGSMSLAEALKSSRRRRSFARRRLSGSVDTREKDHERHDESQQRPQVGYGRERPKIRWPNGARVASR